MLSVSSLRPHTKAHSRSQSNFPKQFKHVIVLKLATISIQLLYAFNAFMHRTCTTTLASIVFLSLKRLLQPHKFSTFRQLSSVEKSSGSICKDMQSTKMSSTTCALMTLMNPLDSSTIFLHQLKKNLLWDRDYAALTLSWRALSLLVSRILCLKPWL